MGEFRLLPMSAVTLEPGEAHLCSFYGQTCQWWAVRKYLIFGPVLGHMPAETSPPLFWKGHITSNRFLLELPDTGSATLRIALKVIGGVLGHMAGQVGKVKKKIERMTDGAPFIAINRDELIRFLFWDEVLAAVTPSHESLDQMIPFIPVSVDLDGEPDLSKRAEKVEEFVLLLRQWFVVDDMREDLHPDLDQLDGT